MPVKGFVRTVSVFVSLLILPAGASIAFTNPKASVRINEILVNNVSRNMDMYFKKLSCWIELYNYGSKEVNLSGYYLTDNLRKPQKWEIPPATVIPAKGFILFWADGENAYEHTNFKLSPSGEVLCLTDPQGRIIDELAYIKQIPDVSFGRYPDGGPRWFYFAVPTPNMSNITRPYRSQRRAVSPSFSVKSGFYTGTQTLQITGPSSGIIRYTTDGSIPDENSSIYKSSLSIDSTMIVRARTFYPGLLPSSAVTNTYFIEERVTLPAVSVAINPQYLWNGKTGIYVMGEDAQTEFPFWGANFRGKWERPVNIEFYEPDGNPGFNVEAGVRTAGTTSLGNAMKSLAVRLRQKYGKEEFNYKIFNNRDFTKFRSFILRNSGDDWAVTVFRDAMIKKICEGRMNVEYQASRPVIVFINGEYWGIHYLTEKIDEFFLASNNNLDHKRIDLLTYSPDMKDHLVRRAIAGRTNEYDNLMNFIENHDMGVPENYRHVKTQIDIDSYLDYTAMQIYIANKGWWSNLKWWKSRDKKGKWRWILYDTDLGFGLYTSHSSDTIGYAMSVDGGGWENPSHLTLLFRKLLANTEFRNDFIQRLASHLNTTFQPERILNIIKICQGEIEPEMPRHMEKWKGQLSCYGFPDNLRFPSTMKQWKSNVEIMRVFASERPYYLRRHIINNFALNGTATFFLQTVNPEGGKVFVGGVEIQDANFKGIYFRDIPLKLEALPNKGYRFIGWEGVPGGNSSSVSVVLKKDTAVRAIFGTAKKK